MNNHKILSTSHHTQSPTYLANVFDEDVPSLEDGWRVSLVDSSSEESSPLLEQKNPSKEDVINRFFVEFIEIQKKQSDSSSEISQSLKDVVGHLAPNPKLLVKQNIINNSLGIVFGLFSAFLISSL